MMVMIDKIGLYTVILASDILKPVLFFRAL